MTTTPTGCTAVLAVLHHSENDLALEVARLAHRHRGEEPALGAEADRLAEASLAHVRDVAAAAGARGLRLDPDPAHPVLHSLWGGASNGAHLSGSALLVDLGRVERTAAGVDLDWQVLAHAAAAAGDDDLGALAERCGSDLGGLHRFVGRTVAERAADIVLRGDGSTATQAWSRE